MEKIRIWFSKLFQDKRGIELSVMLNVPIDGDYDNTAYVAQIKAVLNVVKRALFTSIVLIATGVLLTVGLTAVSITHVWEVLGAIKPSDVSALVIPANVLHYAALAFTVMFDIAFVYLMFVSILSNFSQVNKPNINLLVILLGVLNALFIVKYFPGIDAGARVWMINGLTYISVVLIPLVFIVTLIKLKASIEYCISSYIALSIKQETYTGVLNTAYVSVKENVGTEKELERLVSKLKELGLTQSAIAKVMGGNYQKKLAKVGKILEQQGTLLEAKEN